jgi:hypothetical protein
LTGLYEELKSRGVDMAWYDRRKHPKLDGNIPLENERCSRLSIYLLKKDGSLWTVRSDGDGYSKVRGSEKQCRVMCISACAVRPSGQRCRQSIRRIVHECCEL